MAFLDPFRLDRELRDAAVRVRRWRRALAEGRRLQDDPFLGREFPGKTTFDQVRELREDDPLRKPLLRWIHRLTDERIAVPWTTRECFLERGEPCVVREPREGRYPRRAMIQGVLEGTSAEARAWGRALESHAEPLGRHRAEMAVRRAEVARRLGLVSPDALEAGGVAPESSARRLLDATDELSLELTEPGFVPYVRAALASEAVEGWPARIAPDTLGRLLGDQAWLRSVPLDPGPMPARLAPASFVRAFGQLGFAWAEALAPRDQPFVVAYDPYELGSWSHGFLFAEIPQGAAFARRRLGIGRLAVEGHVRALALAQVQTLRLAALRVLVRRAALSGRATLEASYVELTERLFREPLPPQTALGILRIGVDDPQRFAGALRAAARVRELMEEYDEDWFDNPRAIERVREEVRVPPQVAVDEGELDRGIDALCFVLRARLG